MDLKFLEESFKKGGSIHIKKKNRGKFTDYCGGKVTQSCINKAKASGSDTLKKRAVFAENARKWKHLNGGVILNPYNYILDTPLALVGKFQDGGNIYADFEALDKPDTNPYEWASRNPFDYTYRVDLPLNLSSNSEEETLEEPEENKPYQLTFKDYESVKPADKTTPTKVEEPKVSNNTTKNPAVKEVFDYFTLKGLTKEQASGLVGNFLAESNLNTNATNKEEQKAGLSGYGRGIALWSNSRVQDFVKYVGINPEDASLKLQLDFVWHEIKQRPVLLSQLRKAKTSDESAELIYRGYENGGVGGLATPEQLKASYGPSWARLGLRSYDYNTELNARRKRSSDALSLYV